MSSATVISKFSAIHGKAKRMTDHQEVMVPAGLFLQKSEVSLQGQPPADVTHITLIQQHVSNTQCCYVP